MLSYCCRVINNTGEVTQIYRNSKNQNELKILLESEGYSLLSVKQQSSISNNKLNKNEILQFTQTLALLLNSNLSLKDSLNTAKIGFKKGRINSLIVTLIEGLQKGESFSILIADPVWGLPKLYTGLIKVGEKTGNLKGIVNQLNFYLERDKKLKDKIIGALIYPAIILFISIIFAIVFTFFILPQMKDNFSSFTTEVSAMLDYRAMVFTNIIIGFIILIIVFTIFLFYVKHLKIKDPVKASKIEKLIFKLPIIGKQYMNINSFNFIFSLNILTKSKLSIEESLIYVKDVVNNSFLVLEIEKIRNRIISGEKLSKSFRESIFPERISSFMEVGEKTGEIDDVLKNLSDYYLKENNRELDIFMELINPLLTLFIGIGLLIMVIFFILPVLTATGAIL